MAREGRALDGERPARRLVPGIRRPRGARMTTDTRAVPARRESAAGLLVYALTLLVLVASGAAPSPSTPCTRRSGRCRPSCSRPCSPCTSPASSRRCSRPAGSPTTSAGGP
ncbi:hypothetical protein [Clavibacter tessellarius]|uniref:hypothetical protein n=1 Tax=Clavibacter tessellarius TaxID=31965 RepID=UPI0032476EEE